MELADIYKVFHSIATGYTFFSAAHRAFSKIDHIDAIKQISRKKKSK
jgi:hypothetical protein